MSRAEKARNFFLLFLFGAFALAGVILSAGQGDAKNNAFQELSAAEKQKVFENFKALRKDVRAIHASVIQEKKLAVLKKKIVVKGTITLARPNMLKWDVTKPERSLTVIDGEKMTVYHPDVKEAQIYMLSENIIAYNTMNFFTSVMSGDMGEMEEKFSVRVFRNSSEVIIRMVPRSTMVGRYLAGVVIHVDEKSGLPKGFEVSTPKGDKTVTRLANIKVNPELDPDIFQFRIPGDVMVTNRVEPVGD